MSKDGYINMMDMKSVEELLPCECIYSIMSDKKLKELKDMIVERNFRKVI